jgi:hypothetical protein
MQSEVLMQPLFTHELTFMLMGHFLLHKPQFTQLDLSDTILSCGIFSIVPKVNPPTKKGDIQQKL